MPVFRIVCAIGFALGLSITSPQGAAAGEGDATDARVAVVVLLDTQPLATYRGGIRGLAATAPAVTGGRLDVRSRAATAYRAHVDRRRAFAPALTFDATRDEFLAHELDTWNVNYPSLYIPSMPAILTVSRSVKSVLTKTAKFTLAVIAPPDLGITVPSEFSIDAGATVTFDLTLDASTVTSGQVRHATLLIGKGKNLVRFPITIVRS
jgi:hypothetical protein